MAASEHLAAEQDVTVVAMVTQYILNPNTTYYNGTCVSDGLTKCPDYQGVLIFQVSLCTKGLLWDLN